MTCRRSLPFRSRLNKATSDEFIWRYVHNTNQGVMNFYESGKKFLPHHPWPCSEDRACLRCHHHFRLRMQRLAQACHGHAA